MHSKTLFCKLFVCNHAHYKPLPIDSHGPSMGTIVFQKKNYNVILVFSKIINKTRVTIWEYLHSQITNSDRARWSSIEKSAILVESNISELILIGVILETRSKGGNISHTYNFLLSTNKCEMLCWWVENQTNRKMWSQTAGFWRTSQSATSVADAVKALLVYSQ